MNDVAGEEWARRVQRLGEQERARRLETVNALLVPGDISEPLECEMYILREQLRGGPDGMASESTPAVLRPPSPAEEAVISAARAAGCLCGHVPEDGTGIPPATAARIRAYLQAHPGRQFAYDDGIVAVIVPRPQGGPEVIAWAYHLTELLDQVGAPCAVDPS